MSEDFVVPTIIMEEAETELLGNSKKAGPNLAKQRWGRVNKQVLTCCKFTLSTTSIRSKSTDDSISKERSLSENSETPMQFGSLPNSCDITSLAELLPEERSSKASLLLHYESRGMADPMVQEVEQGEITVKPPRDHVRLDWAKAPSTFLIVSKLHDPAVTRSVRVLTEWLVNVKHVKVLLEPSLCEEIPEHADKSFAKDDGLFYSVDMILCLGGDGTLLHACSLFGSGPVPPVLCFHMGSLGFLMNFEMAEYEDVISAAMRGDYFISLRMRLACQIYRHNKPAKEHLRYTVMNEMVVDRGPSPFLTALELYCDGRYLTTVQADGIIMSTPTGSTAYSLSAGGSMVHPSVNSILFTPICPHILASRPIVFPDYCEIALRVPPDARGTAWASFDGRSRHELQPGDAIVISMSSFPLPTFCRTDETSDWIDSLSECLLWNQRRRQGLPETRSQDVAGSFRLLSKSEGSAGPKVQEKAPLQRPRSFAELMKKQGSRDAVTS